jgi:hypothetical protein
MTTLESYHAFLIKHRGCEHPRCSKLTGSTVVNINGVDLVYCDEHAGRLDAARKSEMKQTQIFYDNRND